MNAELEQKLFDKYPKIFRQKDLSPQETCMCWGISTSDGWYNIIDGLCKKIQKYVDKNKIKQVEAIQVKEKFGGLRFYVTESPDVIYKYIYDAEKASLVTCEECGAKGDSKNSNSHWIRTLCNKCRRKNEKR